MAGNRRRDARIAGRKRGGRRVAQNARMRGTSGDYTVPSASTQY